MSFHLTSRLQRLFSSSELLSRYGISGPRASQAADPAPGARPVEGRSTGQNEPNRHPCLNSVEISLHLIGLDFGGPFSVRVSTPALSPSLAQAIGVGTLPPQT